MKILKLEEIEGIPVLGSLVWKPVRRPLGVTAFGINAYTAMNAGDEVVEEHTEEQLGHEEIYFVHAGHATFTIDGEEVDAPAGTFVFVPDPKSKRHGVATEAGTTVLSFGAAPNEIYTVSDNPVVNFTSANIVASPQGPNDSVLLPTDD